MKPASLSVFVLVPLAMTKFWRFEFLNYLFYKNNAGFWGISGSSESYKMKEHTRWLRYMQYWTENFNGKKADLLKRPMIDPWKDFKKTLFANIVSSLSPAQILGLAKVFCKKSESS